MTDSQAQLKKKRRKQKNILIDFFLKLIFLFFFGLVIFKFIFGIMTIKGEAMYPRVRDGDIIGYYRLDRDFNLDDVVVFDKDGHLRIARIAAKGGDVIDVNEAGALTVNGHQRDEEIFYPTEAIPGGVTYPYTVEQDSYFLLCDFRTQSSDSRDYGAVKEADIKGSMMFLLRRRGF